MRDGPPKRVPEATRIDTVTLALLMVSGVPMAIVDARGDEPDGLKRIPGAKRLSVESTASEVESAVSSKETIVVVYSSDLDCSAGAALCKHLKGLGYENVLVYPDGIPGWLAEGYPLQETG